MEKEKMKKTSVLLVAIAFILGIVLGYAINEATRTEQQFETGQNILKNSGFEDIIDNLPSPWFWAYIPADNLTLTIDEDIKYSGNQSVYINNTHIYGEEYSHGVFNNWAQNIYSIPYKKDIELSGWVKTRNAENVSLIIQCWDEKDEEYTIVDYASTGYFDGTNDWTLYKTTVYFVPSETDFITVRLGLLGTGEVWFDDVTLKIK